MTVHHAAASLPGLCRSLLQIGIGLAFQSTLLLGLGLLAGWALRSRGPALASLLYRSSLLGTLLAVLVSLCVGRVVQPLWQISLPPAADTALQPARLARALEAGDPDAAPLARADLPGLPPSSAVLTRLLDRESRSAGGAFRKASSGQNRFAEPAVSSRKVPEAGRALPGHGFGRLYLLGVGVWAAGALALLLWLVFCQLHIRRIRRNSRSVTSGEAALLLQSLCEQFAVCPPALVVSSQVHTPFLAGVWRPAIFLPAGFEAQFDAAALRAVLAHELVHLSRHDCAWNLLAQLMSVVGWMQPLLWLLGRRMARASEAVCDQEVVRREGDPRAYADCLLRLSERLLPSVPERVVGVGVVTFRSSLGQRIQQIMRATQQRPLSLRVRALVALGGITAAALGWFLVPSLAAPSTQGPDSVLTPGSERPRSALASVPELAKPVTYAETKIPLGELVAKVGAETGVRLTASADVADEPVAVVVKEMPARDLLEQVAELLDYQWARHGKEGARRYEIWQDLASREREEALQQDVLREIENRFRNEIRRYAEVGAMSQAQMQALWDEDRRRNKRWEAMTPEQQKAALNSPEQKEWNRHASLIFPLWSPIARSLAALLGGLTSSQWSRLLQDGELVYSTDPKRNELRMPEGIARTLRSTRPSLNPPEMYSPAEPEAEQRMHQMEQESQAEWASGTGYRVKIELNQLEILQGGTLSLNVGAAPIRDTAGVSYGAPFGGADLLGAAIYINARPMDLHPTNDAAARHAEMERDPVLGARKTFTTTAQPRPMNGIPEIAWRWWLRDLLPVLARTYNVQFISDAYWNHAAQTGVRSAATTPTALYTLLDGAPSFTHDWDHRGSLIRLRSRTWFLDRPREVPLRMVRRWREQYEQLGALPLREYLQMVSELSDAQLLGLDDIASQVGVPADVRDFFMGYSSRHAIRLYSSLGAAQRHSLWSGKPLPVAQMSPTQRALCFAALSDISRLRNPPLDFTQAAGGTLLLSPTPFIRVITRHKGAISLKEESLPEASSAAIAAAELQPGTRPRAAAAAKDEVKRYPVTRLWFIYQCGPNTEERNLLWIATPGSSPSAGEP